MGDNGEIGALSSPCWLRVWWSQGSRGMVLEGGGFWLLRSFSSSFVLRVQAMNGVEGSQERLPTARLG